MNAFITRTIVATAFLAPLAAFAQSATPSATSSSTVSKTESHFVDSAATGGMTEIALSQLALKTSQNPDVKTFAQKMVDDHTKAGDALTQAASKDGLTPPTALDKRHQGMVDSLSKKTGATFDTAYVKDMVTDHDKTVAALQKEIAKGKDQNIVGWAKDTLPTVQSHDDMAHTLQTSLKK